MATFYFRSKYFFLNEILTANILSNYVKSTKQNIKFRNLLKFKSPNAWQALKIKHEQAFATQNQRF